MEQEEAASDLRSEERAADSQEEGLEQPGVEQKKDRSYVILGDLGCFVENQHIDFAEVFRERTQRRAQHAQLIRLVALGSVVASQARVDSPNVPGATELRKSHRMQQQADAIHGDIGMTAEQDRRTYLVFDRTSATTK